MTISQITGSYTSGITLTSPAYANPVTITATGSISGGSLYAAMSWTIVNAGEINEGGSFNTAVSLNDGGALTNEASGNIISGEFEDAVYIRNAAGTVANSGNISGGVFGDGAHLGGGGVILNMTGGVISGGENGVAIDAAPGTVVNSGSISSGNFGAGIYLGDGGAVTNAAGGVIGGDEGGVNIRNAPGTVVNSGSISVTEDSAIYLHGGGSLINMAGGAIYGSQKGVYLGGAGSVINAEGGTITGGTNAGVYFRNGAGTVVNYGSIGFAVAGNGQEALYLGDGGSVTNAEGATISGGSDAGIYIRNAAGTVVNYSSIATNQNGRMGVFLGGGGYVTNAAGAVIYGGSDAGVYIRNAAGTVVNYGSIGSGKFGQTGVYLGGGGYVTNAVGAVIYGASEAGVYIRDAAGTVVNYGSIGTNQNGRTGVSLGGGGSITNAAGAVIYGGQNGVYIRNAAGTVVNYGSIGSGKFGEAGIALFNGGSVINFGAITTGKDGEKGIYLNQGGSVTNMTGAVIYGESNAGIYIRNAAGTVVNYGSIGCGSSGRTGIHLGDGGSVANMAGGVIQGGQNGGLYFESQGGTVFNAGTITGNENAVAFDEGGANRLIVAPGAVFDGDVIAESNGTNTIELVSAASTGTLSGLGSEYQGFQTVTIDSGASWTIEGAKAGFSGVTIGGFGTGDTLDVTDVAFSAGDTATLNGSDLLTVKNSGGTTLVAVQLSGSFVAGEVFRVASDGASGIDIEERTLPISRIIGAYVNGIALTAAAYTNPVTVTANGTVSGATGLSAASAWTIQNYGGITGTAHYGVDLAAGGWVTNEAGGAISGASDGVLIANAAGTVENAGTISGGVDAVDFGGKGANLLIVDPGAVFDGKVVANAAGNNTIELNLGTSAGTLAGLGSEYIGFKAITIQAGATWTIAGTEAGFSGVAIGGFNPHATLDVTDLAFDSADTVTLGAGNVLDIENGSSVTIATIQLGAANFTGFQFALSSDGAATPGTDITLVPPNVPPVTTVPSAQTIGGEVATAISGISIADKDATSAGKTFTVVLSDSSGLLSVRVGRLGDTVSGIGTTSLTLSGTLAQVNALLSTLTYTATGLGSDSIDVAVNDGRGGSDDSMIGITVIAPPETWAARSRVGAWGTKTNWSGGLVPDAGIDTTLGAEASNYQAKITAGQSFSVNNLTLGGTTAVLPLAGSLTVNGALDNSGRIQLSGSGVLDVAGAITGTGGLQIRNDGTLSVGAVAASQSLSFIAGATGTLVVNDPLDTDATVRGFAVGQTIDLKNVAETSFGYAGGVLTVENGTSVVAMLAISGNFAGKHFALSSDHNGGTDVTLAVGSSSATPDASGVDRHLALFAEAIAAHGQGLSFTGEMSRLHASPEAASGWIAASQR